MSNAVEAARITLKGATELLGMASGSSSSASSSTGAQGNSGSMIAMTIMGVLGIALYIWSAITVANAHSASQDFGVLKNTIPTLIGQTLVATLLLYAAMLMYVIQDLHVTIYILIAMVFLTFAFAYGAVAIAAMSR
jgi:hypothetical protein